MNMKLKSLGLGLASAVALGLCASTTQAAISLDFSNLPRTALQFNGANNSFQLNPTAGPQFQIVNVTGGSGSAIGLNGYVDNGPYTYGPITVSGPDQSATVTSGGTLHLGPAGDQLTGTVDWIKVTTMGSIGGINANLTVNVTGLSYSGANPDLITLANATGAAGSMNISFQFSPGKSLTELSTGTDTFRTSYSGSISTFPPQVPEPTTLLAGAMLLLPFGVSAMRMLRRKS